MCRFLLARPRVPTTTAIAWIRSGRPLTTLDGNLSAQCPPHRNRSSPKDAGGATQVGGLFADDPDVEVIDGARREPRGKSPDLRQESGRPPSCLDLGGMRPARVAFDATSCNQDKPRCVNPPRILGRADDPPNPSLQCARWPNPHGRNTSCSTFEKQLCRREKSNPRAALKMSKFIIVAGVAHPPCV
jgi:hypothetical protein